MSKKLSRGAKAPKSETVRVNLSLGKEEYQLLFIRALTSGRSAGELVTQLVAAKAREWGLPANLIARSGVHDRFTASGPVNDSAASDAEQLMN